MSKRLIWKGEYASIKYQLNFNRLIETEQMKWIKPIMSIKKKTKAIFGNPWRITIIGIIFLILAITPFGIPLLSILGIVIIGTILTIGQGFFRTLGRQTLNLFDPDFERAVFTGYLSSMEQARSTEYPQGIVYILKNVLEHLNLFGINHVGNRAVLKEAINMAQTLSQEWENLNTLEQSLAMQNIRQKIDTEEYKSCRVFIDGAIKDMVIKNKYNYEIYIYYYDFNDYEAERKLSTKETPSPTNNNNSTTILNFPDWVNQNSALQHFSEAQQQKAYQKYLAEKGVKQQISFEEYVNQNPALEFFSLEEQQEAYQKYLQENS